MGSIEENECNYITCPKCGTKNRTKVCQANLIPLCGKCHSRLLPDIKTREFLAYRGSNRIGVWPRYKSYFVPLICLIVVISIVLFYKQSKEIPKTSNHQTPQTLNRKLLNGYILSQISLNGNGCFTVNNGTSKDAVVIIKGASYACFYVSAFSNATIKGLLDGDYRVVFQTGTDWDDLKKAFTRDRSQSIFDKNFSFTTRIEQNMIVYKNFEITLHQVAGGNLTKSSLSKEGFEKFMLPTD